MTQGKTLCFFYLANKSTLHYNKAIKGGIQMIEFSSLHYPYPSQRHVMMAKNGMVATSQHLAAMAGYDILKKGGNAVDAAIATAACLTVVQPTSNGIGGDAFAIVWMKDQLYGLNASGKAPTLLSIDALHQRGYQEMPKYGFAPVTVPGTPSAWVALSKRFGRLPLIDVLTPAITYAKEGFPVSPTLAKHWQAALKVYETQCTDSMFDEWFRIFTHEKKSPVPGEVWQSIDHANTLMQIGLTEGDAFYRGNLADQIDAFSRQHNGFLRKEDLANHQVEWVQPISVNYRGYDVWELPPNGQGLVCLQALNIMKEFDISNEPNEETVHKQIESLKCAFADGLAYISDPSSMQESITDLLSESYAMKRQSTITDRAQMPKPGKPSQGGTVYLATADKDGNMVSYIQSNYMGFGSGLVVPHTGIALHNRGHNFSMNPKHPNALTPNKRPYHTIIPGFLTQGNTPIGPFGVMGGFMQPQGHMQVMMNTIDFHFNPQAAIDAPRWQWIEGNRVLVEPMMPKEWIEGLKKRGHEILVESNPSSFGCGQIIWRDPKTKVLFGGTERRTDSAICCW